MTNSVTTQSTITNGQIGQINDRLATKLRESGLPAEVVQIVLSTPGGKVIDEMVIALRRRVEAISKMVVRRVKVNRTRTPQGAIHATGRTEYLNDEVVNSMPHSTQEEVEVCFFPLEKFTGVADVQKMLEDHGLEPDPYALAAVNEEDPSFADIYPNNTQWADSNGNRCFLAFGRFGGGRKVYCYRSEDGWRGSWWIGGVRKQSSGA